MSAQTPVHLTPLQTCARLLVTLTGSCVLALGISLAKHAAVGTTPISCLPAVLYEFFRQGHPGVTLGLFTLLLNGAFFVAEVVALRRRFPLAQLLQLPLVLVFSLSVDLWMTRLMPLLPNHTPLARYLLLAAAILVMALGIQLQLVGDTLITPPEAFIGIVARRTGRPYGDVKVAFDVVFLVTGTVLSFLLLDGLTDVREGSLVAAVGVGVAIKGWDRVLRPLARRLPSGPTAIPPLPLR